MSLLRLRLELAAIELKEGVEQRRKALVLGSIAVVFLAVSLLLLAVLVVVFFWDTHRMSAISGVTFVYAGIGTAAYLRFRGEIRRIPPPLSVTLAEFRKDLDLLRGNHEPD